MNDKYFYKNKKIYKVCKLISESYVLLKNKNKFKNKKILFSGNIEDKSFLLLNNINNKLHIQKYYDDNLFQNISKKDICFRSLARKKYSLSCHTLIFFWTRNKIECQFQLQYLLSIMNITSEIFIVGRKIFGINSVKTILNNWIDLKKIDYKKKCNLYYGILKNKKKFILKKFIKKYIIFNTIITVLPGLFDYKGIDQGSLLMINAFKKKKYIQGKVLDLGSGSGILSIVLKKIHSNIQIVLIDNNSTALLCSKYNLKKNKVSGHVYYSNIYSKINEKFNYIISNPPTHYGIHNNYSIIYKIIKDAKKFLYKNGILWVVIHSNIPCKNIFTKYFGNYKIIVFNKHFCMYEAILKYPERESNPQSC